MGMPSWPGFEHLTVLIFQALACILALTLGLRIVIKEVKAVVAECRTNKKDEIQKLDSTSP